MNLKELKEICKNNNIKNYSKLNKSELIKLINKILKGCNNPQENIFEFNSTIYSKKIY